MIAAAQSFLQQAETDYQLRNMLIDNDWDTAFMVVVALEFYGLDFTENEVQVAMDEVYGWRANQETQHSRAA